MNTATARIHCNPHISEKTLTALAEMMRVALKQFAHYEGPFTVEIIPDREPFFESFEPSKNLTYRKIDKPYE